MRDHAEISVPHCHAWLWEPLEVRSTFVRKAMFGTQAAYLDGKLVACFCTKAEPWRGVLLATSREHHESLRAEFPELKPHRILSKWLYLSEGNAHFESVAPQLIRLALRGDPRVGVIPPLKKKRAAARSPKRTQPRLRQ